MRQEALQCGHVLTTRQRPIMSDPNKPDQTIPPGFETAPVRKPRLNRTLGERKNKPTITATLPGITADADAYGSSKWGTTQEQEAQRILGDKKEKKQVKKDKAPGWSFAAFTALLFDPIRKLFGAKKAAKAAPIEPKPSMMSRATKAITETLGTVLQKISGGVGWLFEQAQSAIANIAGFLHSPLRQALQLISGLVGKLAEGLGRVLAAVTGLFAKFWAALPSTSTLLKMVPGYTAAIEALEQKQKELDRRNQAAYLILGVNQLQEQGVAYSEQFDPHNWAADYIDEVIASGEAAFMLEDNPQAIPRLLLPYPEKQLKLIASKSFIPHTFPTLWEELYDARLLAIAFVVLYPSIRQQAEFDQILIHFGNVLVQGLKGFAELDIFLLEARTRWGLMNEDDYGRVSQMALPLVTEGRLAQDTYDSLLKGTKQLVTQYYHLS